MFAYSVTAERLNIAAGMNDRLTCRFNQCYLSEAGMFIVCESLHEGIGRTVVIFDEFHYFFGNCRVGRRLSCHDRDSGENLRACRSNCQRIGGDSDSEFTSFGIATEDRKCHARILVCAFKNSDEISDGFLRFAPLASNGNH